ncbi:MAG: transporter substrate-binding domain-containing protein [Eubacterium sp.]|nr:transporter substrate-binding domain-containing protein [Eubacterium sp.]
MKNRPYFVRDNFICCNMKALYTFALMLIFVVSICLSVSPVHAAGASKLISSDTKLCDKKSIDELNNSDVTIGVVEGFIFGDQVKQHLPNAKISYYETREAAFKALSLGSIDAVVDDDAIIRAMMRSTDQFQMMDEYLEDSYYSFIFSKNEDGYALSQRFSEYITKLRFDGTLAELDSKWFGDRTDNKTSEALPIAAEAAISFTNDAEAAENTNASDVTEDSNNKKILRLALDDDGSIPFAYMSAGKPVGYEIDILVDFCKEYGYEVSIDMTDFANMQTGVSNGTYDLGCGGITITDERKKSLNFCSPVYRGGVAVCVLNKKTARVNNVSKDEATNPDADSEVKSQDTLGQRDSTEVINNNNLQRESRIANLKRHFRKAFIEDRRYMLFTNGIAVTLIISLFAVLFGSPFGFLLYKGAKRGTLFIKFICKAILWITQGVPSIVLIMILYYAFYRDLFIGGIIASITGFTFAFAEMSYRNIDKNSRRVEEGKIAEDYRLEYFDDKEFINRLLRACGNDLLEDFRDNLVTVIKASAVVGYVAVQDMVKTFDKIRMESLETVLPLLATTIIYIIIIKIITHAFRPAQ